MESRRKDAPSIQVDVDRALASYLQLEDSAPKQTQQEHLATLVGKVKATDDPATQSTLVLRACPLRGATASRIESLKRGLAAQRFEATSNMCPDKMYLEFQDKSWDEYYPGGNIKYPPVDDMGSVLCADTPIQKMMLFDLLHGERQQCSDFMPPDLSALDPGHLSTHAAIIVPSGGKSGDKLGILLNSTWWGKLRKQVHVVLVIAADELANYSTVKDVSIVTYQGFGIGCGRAAGIEVAKKLDRLCFMTDDRTKDLLLNNEKVDAERMKAFLEDEGMKALPWISGVMPRVNLNVMTIINPKATTRKPTFPKYFIASKEDVSLYLYCLALEAISPKYKCRSECYQFQVKFDAANDKYTNKAYPYPKEKLGVMNAMLSSKRYRGLSDSDERKVLDWTYLKASKGFLNEWDAIKMQESAIYQLLESIVGDLDGIDWKAKENAEVDRDEIMRAFVKYIHPWFS